MTAIVDAGPLIAYFDKAERHHQWVAELLEELELPLLVCEPVLTEAYYLLGAVPTARDALLALLQDGVIAEAFHIDEHVGDVRKLLRKYQDRPMSLADACVVRMAEIHERHSILTLDADFSVYRKHGRTPLAVISPDSAR